jgi:hypothetical protein
MQKLVTTNVALSAMVKLACLLPVIVVQVGAMQFTPQNQQGTMQLQWQTPTWNPPQDPTVICAATMGIVVRATTLLPKLRRAGARWA